MGAKLGQLSTTISLTDNMSPKLREINRHIGKTIGAMKQLDRVGNALNGGSMGKALQSWANTSKSLTKELSKIINQAQKGEQQLTAIKEKGVEARLNIDKRAAKQMELYEQKRLDAARRAGLLKGINVNEFGKDYEGIYKAIKAQEDATKAAREQAKLEEKTKREAEQAAKAAEKKRLQEERAAKALAKQQSAYAQIKSLASKIRNIATLAATTWGAVRGIGAVVQLSDKMTMNDAKMRLITGGDVNAKNDLEAKTFAAAQRSTTDYLEFTKAVGKLGILAGDKFKNNDSIVRFVELMNKSFQISGAETSERNAAMLQITQAIASNRLQGDEFRSILENAPMVMQALAKSLNVGHDKLKAMAKEGEITADVLIKAMFGAGKKIEEMYSQLDMTWERHWQKMKNVGTLAFKPIHEQFKKLFNSQKFQSFINGVSTALIVLGNIGGWLFGKIFDIVNGISNFVNWVRNLTGVLGKLRDIIFAVSTALLLYKGYQLIVLGLTKLQVLWNTLLGITTLALEAIIRLARTAWGLYIACQIAYNGAATFGAGITAVLQVLLGNLAVIIGVILVAALILFVMWLYKSSESAADAVGKIVGAFYWLWAAVCNVFIWIANIVDGVCQWVVNAWDWCCNNMGTIFDNIGIWWNNLWVDARIGFYGFINDVLTKLSALAQKIQPLAELLNVDLSGMIGKAQGSITGRITALEGQKKSYKSLSPFKSVDWSKYQYKDLGEAYDKGYNKGYDTTTKITDKMHELTDKLDDLTKVELGGQKVTADALNGMGDKLGDIGDSGANTAKNTGDTAKNTSKTNDYSYLRDWYYQKGLGNSIGYNIKIEQNNRNNVASGLDVNKIADMLLDKIIEGLNTGKEGARI